MKYLEFANDLFGYHFYDKKSGEIVYKYELFARGLSSVQVFQQYKSVIRCE